MYKSLLYRRLVVSKRHFLQKLDLDKYLPATKINSCKKCFERWFTNFKNSFKLGLYRKIKILLGKF